MRPATARTICALVIGCVLIGVTLAALHQTRKPLSGQPQIGRAAETLVASHVASHPELVASHPELPAELTANVVLGELRAMREAMQRRAGGDAELAETVKALTAAQARQAAELAGLRQERQARRAAAAQPAEAERPARRRRPKKPRPAPKPAPSSWWSF